MSNTSIDDDFDIKPVGNLAKWAALQQSGSLPTQQARTSVWDRYWKGRGNFPFRVAPGSATHLIFLDDISLSVGYNLGFSIRSGRNGQFLNTSFIPSPVIQIVDMEVNVLDEDWVTPILGTSNKKTLPKRLAIAPILEKKTVTRDGKTSTFQICPLEIEDTTDAFRQIMSATGAKGKSPKGFVFMVQRSSESTSSNVGTSWIVNPKQVDPLSDKDLDEKFPGWKQLLEKVNFAEGYRTPTKEEFLNVLEQHCRLTIKMGVTNHGINLEALEDAVGHRIQPGKNVAMGTAPTNTKEEDPSEVGVVEDDDPFSALDDDGDVDLDSIL